MKKIIFFILLFLNLNLTNSYSSNELYENIDLFGEVLEKIKRLKSIKEEEKINFDIEIDGGINFDNSKAAIEAGANILVSGTTIFKSNNGDIKKNIELLKSK